MKVIVLGAGLEGTASAWYLRAAGHQVVVLERQPAAGMETSFANGGQISVSHAEPWANPGAPIKVLKWLAREDAPLLFRLRADPRQWLWGLQFRRRWVSRDESGSLGVEAMPLVAPVVTMLAALPPHVTAGVAWSEVVDNTTAHVLAWHTAQQCRTCQPRRSTTAASPTTR